MLNSMRGSVLLGAALTAWAMSEQAKAQDASSSEKPAEETQGALQEVVVTGSRLAQRGFSSPTPTAVVDAQELQDRAPSVLIDALALLPELRASATPSTAGNAVAGTGGQSFVNIRGLGPNRTLVLLNGQRPVPSTNTDTVDISLLPSSLIKRIDVVTGGASAAYGSDAVAGVVNFVLDNDLSGLKTDVGTGISPEGDNEEYHASLALGGDLSERLHGVLAGEWFRSQGVDPRSRDFAQSVDNLVPSGTTPPTAVRDYVYLANATFGGLIVGGPLGGTQFLPGGVTAPYVGCPITSGTTLVCDSQRPDLPWTQYFNYLRSPQERGSGYAALTYQATPALILRATAHYGESYTKLNSIPPSTLVGGPYTIQRENPFIPAPVQTAMDAAGITSFQLGRYSRDMPNVYSERDARVWQLNGSAEYELSPTWHLEALVGYGENKLFSSIVGNVITANQRRAVDVVSGANGAPTCRSTLTDPTNGCVPLNLFGEGAPSDAANAYIRGDSHINLSTHLVDAAVNLRGNPFSTWAGPVSTATGVEYREQELDQTVDALSNANAFLFNNPKPLSGSVRVWEGYVETNVPLLHSKPLAHSLDLNAAARHTDYSTIGDVQTWKVGLTYSPIEDILFRSTRSRDIRAPNIVELNSPMVTTSGALPVFDPTTGQQTTIFTYAAGNKDLEAESADTFTIGVVLQPKFLRGFRMSLDYYNIELHGAITTLTPQQILNGCAAGQTDLCSAVTRDGSGQLVSVTATNFNLSELKVNGFDVQLEQLLNMADFSKLPGSLVLRAHGNYNADYTQVSQGVSVDLSEGIGNPTAAGFGPRLQWELSAAYSLADWGLFLQGTRIGSGVFQPINPQNVLNNSVKAMWYLNAGLQRTFTLDGDRTFQLYFNVDNLTDQEPPLGYHILGGNYDRIGTMFKVGVRSSLR